MTINPRKWPFGISIWKAECARPSSDIRQTFTAHTINIANARHQYVGLPFAVID